MTQKFILRFFIKVWQVYPCEWKKVSVTPIHKKGGKQTLSNYRPLTLLSICNKMFERLLYNEMFGFFLDKGLVSANQSGFKAGNSCINQLLSITHYKLEMFSLTFQKHLIKSGMMVLY